MRIIFMGTPEFAVPSLEVLKKEHEIIAVYTKLDKPNARGKKINYSPVKTYALEHNIEVIQVGNFKDKETIEKIKDLNPDLIVVVAYGKLLPNEVLEIPKYGVVNVHSSLLPKYRGAAPINEAIIKGEKETGVSIMYVEEKLDAGDVITYRKTDIRDEDTFLSLHDRLKELGSLALEEAVKMIEQGNVKREKQDETKVSFVKPYKKEDCKIDWNKTEREVFNFVRGMNPFPGAFSIFNEKLFKIYEVKENKKIYEEGKVGDVVDLIKGLGIVIKVSNGSVIITKAKPENKKMMTGSDLINGNFFKK